MVQLATKSVIKIDASVAVVAAATGADDAMPSIGFGSSNQAATPLKPSNVWGESLAGARPLVRGRLAYA